MSGVCHLIGGGASLKGFEFESLRGEFCIAVNDAYKVLPSAPVVFFALEEWAQKNLAGLQAHAGLKIHVADWTDPPEKFLQLRLTNRHGLDFCAGCVAGANSGHMALNLAVNFGFQEVWLYGFDMGPTDGACHFHGDALRESLRGEYDYFRDKLDAVAPELLARGVRVWNLSPDSRLRAFPKIDIRPLTKPEKFQ